MSSINRTKKVKSSKKKHAFKLDDVSEDVRSFTTSSSSKASLNHSSETTANNFLNYNEVLTNILDSYKPNDLLIDDREYTDDDSGVNNSNYASLIAESEAFSLKHETDTPFIEEDEVELKLSNDQSETNHSESKESSDNQASGSNQTEEEEEEDYNNTTGDEYESTRNTPDEDSDIDQETIQVIEEVITETLEAAVQQTNEQLEELTPSNDSKITKIDSDEVKESIEELNNVVSSTLQIEVQNEVQGSLKSEEFVSHSSDEEQIDTINEPEQQQIIKDDSNSTVEEYQSTRNRLDEVQETIHVIEEVITQTLNEETVHTELPTFQQATEQLEELTPSNDSEKTKTDSVEVKESIEELNEAAINSETGEQYESTAQIDDEEQRQIKKDQEKEFQNKIILVKTDSNNNEAHQEFEPDSKEQILRDTSEKPPIDPSEKQSLKYENKKELNKNHDSSVNKLVWASIVVAAISIGATLFARYKNKF